LSARYYRHEPLDQISVTHRNLVADTYVRAPGPVDIVSHPQLP